MHDWDYTSQTYTKEDEKVPCTGICKGHIIPGILYSGADYPGPHDSQKDKEMVEQLGHDYWSANHLAKSL